MYDEYTHRQLSLSTCQDPSRSLHDYRPLLDLADTLEGVRQLVVKLRTWYHRYHKLATDLERHHKDRMAEYNTRLLQYPTGGVLDASLTLAVPLRFLELPPGEPVKSTECMKFVSFFVCEEGASISPRVAVILLTRI